MKINGVMIDDAFAEAFPMQATGIIITAIDLQWAYRAANSIIGFASSVIACGCEADIERELKPTETPDGRPGLSVSQTRKKCLLNRSTYLKTVS